MTELPTRLDDLIDHVKQQHPEGDPLTHLSLAVLTAESLGELSDHLVGHFVDQARRAGASWTDIGRNMGVTKQAAQKRFVPRSSADLDPGAFSRFTDRARHCIVAAQDEARASGHDHIETGHLVLGLLAEPEGLAVRAIEALGVTTDAVREAATAILGPTADSVLERLPFTASGKKVLDLTIREALRLGHPYVGTEHLLLALLRADGTDGAKALTGLGVTTERAEPWLLATLEELRGTTVDG